MIDLPHALELESQIPGHDLSDSPARQALDIASLERAPHALDARNALLALLQAPDSVVDGFDRAVVGMRVGGVRQAIVPPNLAYGDEGAKPKIPPRAVLVFEIRLLDVEDAATSLNKKPGHVVKKDDRKARRQGKKPGGAPGQRRKRQVR